MSFKKALIILLALVVSLSLAVGCEEEPLDEKDEAAEDEVEEEEEEVEEEETLDIDIVVGFDAGGSHDVTARYLAEALRDYDIEADVVKMPGAMGTEGAYHVANQDPDENIFFWGHALALLFEPATHDTGFTIDDFDPVATLASPTFAFASREGAKWDDLDELYEYMEENPGEVSVGTQGEGNSMHWVTEQLLPPDEYDYDLIAYEGGADVQSNLEGQHVDLGHLSLAAAQPLHEAGDLSVLVNTQILVERDPLLEDVPNVIEHDVDAQEPHPIALWAPSGANEDIIDRIAEAMGEAGEDEELQENYAESGVVTEYLDTEETDEFFTEIEEEMIPEFEEWLEEQ